MRRGVTSVRKTQWSRPQQSTTPKQSHDFYDASWEGHRRETDDEPEDSQKIYKIYASVEQIAKEIKGLSDRVNSIREDLEKMQSRITPEISSPKVLLEMNSLLSSSTPAT